MALSVPRWLTLPSALAAGRTVASGYAAGTFAFFVRQNDDVLRRALVHNALTDAEQRSLTLSLVLGIVAVAGVVAALTLRLLKGGSLEERFARASYAPLAFLPLGLWPSYQVESVEYVRLLLIITIAGLVGLAIHLWNTRLRPPTLPKIPYVDRLAPVLVVVAGIAHGIVMGTIAVRLYTVLFDGWDLAIYSQVHWNIITTFVPWSTAYTDASQNHYAIHFSPIYHVTALIYWLHPSPATLLWIENIALGLGALPLYAFVRRKTDSTVVAVLIAAAYLLNPVAHGLMLHDFHEIVLFVPLMLGLIWAVERENKAATIALLVLTLMIREDTPAYLIVYALWLVSTGKRPIGLRILAVSAVYLVAVHGVLMPYLRGGTSYVFDDRYSGLVRVGQQGKASIVETLSTNGGYALGYVFRDPEKWHFVVLLLLPVAFLPLLSGRALLLLLPGVAFSLLSSFSAQYSIEFHYAAPILPFLWLTATLGIVRLRSPVPAAAACLVATCLLAGKEGRDPLLRGFITRKLADVALVYGDDAPKIHEAALAIPKDNRCVRATGNLLVQVAERRAAHIVPWGKHCDWSFIDYSPDGRNAPSTNGAERQFLLEQLRSGDFGIAYLDQRVVLLGRGQRQDRNQELIDRLERMPVAP